MRVMRSLLAAQQTFVDRLVHLMKAVQRESGNRKKKVSPGSEVTTQPTVLTIDVAIYTNSIVCFLFRDSFLHAL